MQADVKKPKVSAKGRKAKGSAYERKIAKAIGGRRVAFSGAYAHLGREFAEDVISPDKKNIQCKFQDQGFKTLHKWLKTADLLALGSTGNRDLIVMPIDLYIEYLNIRCVNERDGREVASTSSAESNS
jgi:hypothetical protein